MNALFPLKKNTKPWSKSVITLHITLRKMLVHICKYGEHADE